VTTGKIHDQTGETIRFAENNPIAGGLVVYTKPHQTAAIIGAFDTIFDPTPVDNGRAVFQDADSDHRFCRIGAGGDNFAVGGFDGDYGAVGGIRGHGSQFAGINPRVTVFYR